MTKLVYIVLIAFVFACSPKTVSFTNSDVERAASKFPESTMATLTEGHAHYKKYCGSCHPYKSPTSKNEDQWKTIIPKMVLNANKKEGKQVITPKMEQEILTYVVTMSTAPKK